MVMVETVQQPALPEARFSEDHFFFYMAVACAAVAFVGFAPTYWVPLLNGRLSVHPLIHLHAVIFFGWSVFFVYQSWLAASGRLRSHRRAGMIGVSLATAMVLVGIGTAINRMHWATGLGQADAGKTFAIVPIGSVLYFAVLLTAAVVSARHRDWHKRLMLVAAISILNAAIARWFIVFLAPEAPAGPPPVAVDLGPSFVALLMLLLAMFVDWRRYGRPHAAFVLGTVGYVAIKVLQVPFSETPAWHAIATGFMHLGG
jgi:hypothetical protein